jgi:hypothetical protein
MEFQVSWATAIILIAVAAAHIAEETVARFREFFNMEWFTGNEDCPVTRFKGLVVDKIGLFLFLAAFAAAGAVYDGRVMFIAVGIILADLVQHAVFSIGKKSYTPGVATSAAYLAYVVYFFGYSESRHLLNDPLAWVAMVAGAAFIAGNYWIARRKVQRGDCQLAIA